VSNTATYLEGCHTFLRDTVLSIKDGVVTDVGYLCRVEYIFGVVADQVLDEGVKGYA
jgi:hypothetical protein